MYHQMKTFIQIFSLIFLNICGSPAALMDGLLHHKTVVSCQLCTMATSPPSNFLLYQPNSMLNELQVTLGLREGKNHCATTELNLACSLPS